MAGGRFYRARRIMRVAAAALMAAGAAACDGVPTDVELGRFAGGADQAESQLDPRLVGTWSRLLFFGGDFGNTVTNETRYTFRDDGRFVRRQITNDFTTGFGDEVVAQGTWRTLNGTLVLDFEQPVLEGVQLAYRVESTIDGDRLLLDGLLYVLVPGTP